MKHSIHNIKSDIHWGKRKFVLIFLQNTQRKENPMEGKSVPRSVEFRNCVGGNFRQTAELFYEQEV
jgi:hypothetical protein